MNVLILEDAQYRIKDFRSALPFAKIVKDVDSCIEQLEKQGWDLLFLDHDLDGQAFVDPQEYNTGSEVVRWIVKNKPEIGRIIVHTHNSEVAVDMVVELLRTGYKVERKKFLSLNLEQFVPTEPYDYENNE